MDEMSRDIAQPKNSVDACPDSAAARLTPGSAPDIERFEAEAMEDHI